MADQPKTINILGATGSIGDSTADVLSSVAGAFDVRVVTANNNAKKLAEIAIKLKAKSAVLADENGYMELKALLAGHDIECASGTDALLEASSRKADITMAAIMGMAGLEPLLCAIQNSNAVAIANKEPLVAAGALVMEEARKCGTTLLPVDSEHNAVFQVFDQTRRAEIERIILTASGGPFRSWAPQDIETVTPEQALAHPNWSMGRKISIDSATLMNKALEVIEAHILFDILPEKIDVVVHPQSVIHSMVEYCDGSILAQLGANDMRTPICNVLNWPARIATPGQKLDLAMLQRLDFEAPDHKRFPALNLAYECLKEGPHACIAMNAANEVAVEHFLKKNIGFPDIIKTVTYILDRLEKEDVSSLEKIINYDTYIRSLSNDCINNAQIDKTVAIS